MIRAAPLLLLLLIPRVHSTGDALGLAEREEKEGEKKDGLWLSGVQEMQNLAEISWEYMQDLQCWLWPDKCEDERNHKKWNWRSFGWDSLNLLTDLYAKVLKSREFTRVPITNNFTGLQFDLEKRVYGQHQAVKQILTSLKRFLKEDSKKTTLTLAFHGWSGTGKNLAARIIAENLYQNGQQSLCSRVFIPQLHFPDLSQVETYKVQLRKQIQAVSSTCAQPLFVFDEADNLPSALLQSIFPLLRPAETQDTKSIFIFFSEIGTNLIFEEALSFWRDGRPREEITLDILHRLVLVGVYYNTDKCLTYELWIRDLIDEFVPFLPLERSHLKLCAKDALEAQGLPYSESALESVIEELMFVPEENIFAAYGCKQVAQRINFMKL